MPYWPVRDRGADAFRGDVLDEASAEEAMDILCQAKRDGLIDLFSAHDDDILPWDPENPEDYLDPTSPIHKLLAKLKAKADAAGLKMHMMTCNLHGHWLFGNGGFANPNPAIRLLAIKKALRAAWIGNFFGAEVVTYWVARDGFEVPAAVPFKGINPTNPEEGPYQWIQGALNMIAYVCRKNGYSIKHGTIEVKCNEPRGVFFLPLAGSALALICGLDDPDFWGENPEVLQHAAMGCQDPLLEVVQTAESGKLFFLHIGGQIPGQFDNDFRFLGGPTGLKQSAMIFYYLALIDWDGVIEIDSHAFRCDMSPGPEVAKEVRARFIRESIEMYRMVEQIIVPRLLKSEALREAQQQIWNPPVAWDQPANSWSDVVYGNQAAALKAVLTAKVDVNAIRANPPATSRVDRIFNMLIAGVSEEDLAKVMAT